MINRPWSLQEMLKQPGFAERVREQYVYIAETDHLLLQDLPNRATPLLNVAFFFPYMSPVPEAQARDRYDSWASRATRLARDTASRRWGSLTQPYLLTLSIRRAW